MLNISNIIYKRQDSAIMWLKSIKTRRDNKIMNRFFTFLALLFAAIVLLRLAPYLLIFGAAVFAYFKINSRIKRNRFKKENIKSEELRQERESSGSGFDFSGKQVIDVDYKEVK